MGAFFSSHVGEFVQVAFLACNYARDVFIRLLHRRHSSDTLSLGGWSCSCDLGSFRHLHYANAKRDCTAGQRMVDIKLLRA